MEIKEESFIIDLYKFTFKFPVFRDQADDLFKYINNLTCNNIIIDFSNIDLINHSFASQYTINKKNSNKNIKEINENEDVRKMFEFKPNKKSLNFNEIQLKEL